MTSLQKRTAETPGAQRTSRTRRMRGEAWGVGATRSGIVRCERCAAAV